MARHFYRSNRKLTATSVIGAMLFLGAVYWLREDAGVRSIKDINDFAGDTVILVAALGALAAPVLFAVWLARLGAKLSKRGFSAFERRVLEYWRQSVIDSQRMALPEREVQEFGCGADWREIKKGRVPLREVNRLFQRAEELRLRSSGQIDVLIAPLTLRRGGRTEDRDVPRLVSPLWIPALLSGEGSLSPPFAAYPWIPRVYLEPVAGDTPIVLGTVQDAEDYALRNPLERPCSWSGYIRYAEKMLRAVCAMPLENFRLEGYLPAELATLLVDTTAGGGRSGISRLYSDMLSNRCATGLAPAIAQLENRRARAAMSSKRAVLRAATRHCAQFQASFPLSRSQRQAVHEALSLRDGEILAVTGPPGTGKTTFIQTVVASLWTQSAADGAALPPLVVACSATNQAVTNVIESFARTGGTAHERWLPRFSSYGTFCSSQTKSKEIEDIPYILADGSGTVMDIEQPSYIKEAENYYLTRFTGTFFKTRSVARAVTTLRRELRSELSLLRRELRSASDGTSLLETSAASDKSRRFKAFQLATHYWEGRWILNAHELVEIDRRRGNFEKTHWQLRAMITPCLVSTFFMAPEFFGRRAARLSPPVDMLIVDEAGQVPPEVAGATFALAGKAIVTGDPWQLEPVWGIPEYADRGNLMRFGLLKSMEHHRFESLAASGLTASGGSLMQRALTVGAVERGSGIFLSEHRRSVPQIVSFANELCYAGRLKAERPEIGNRILPAFGYIEVNGTCTLSGKSRMNAAEARSIERWLRSNAAKLEAAYNMGLPQIVAILTPFTAQTRELQHTLRPHYPDLVIGTVNALQGAERPIVIFSSVYDLSTRGTLFFDQKPNLLNVAVTRAKDTFLLFGNPSIFKSNQNLPSSTLARHLFASPSNKLT